jgi:hypothetical protein
VNIVTYVLSQKPCIFSMIPLQANLRENILTIQFDQGWYKEVEEIIEEDAMTIPRFEGYTLENDRLMSYNNRIYVPPNEKLRNLILSEARRKSIHGSSRSHEDEGKP